MPAGSGGLALFLPGLNWNLIFVGINYISAYQSGNTDATTHCQGGNQAGTGVKQQPAAQFSFQFPIPRYTGGDALAANARHGSLRFHQPVVEQSALRSEEHTSELQ